MLIPLEDGRFSRDSCGSIKGSFRAGGKTEVAAQCAGPTYHRVDHSSFLSSAALSRTYLSPTRRLTPNKSSLNAGFEIGLPLDPDPHFDPDPKFFPFHKKNTQVKSQALEPNPRELNAGL